MEFILVLPIILLILILVFHAMRVSHIAQDLQYEARTAAWQNTLFETACSGVPARLRSSRAVDNHPLVITCHDPDYLAADEFLRQTRNAGATPRLHWNSQGNVTRMTQVLEGTAPEGIMTRARTLYFLRQFDAAETAARLRRIVEGALANPSLESIAEDLMTGRTEQGVRSVFSSIKLLSSEYALDARPAWRNDADKGFQIGYDNFYWNRFPIHFVINDYFPCATGNEGSAARGNCNPPPPREYTSDKEFGADPYEQIEQMCTNNCTTSAREQATRLATTQAEMARDRYLAQNPQAPQPQLQNVYDSRYSAVYGSEYARVRSECLRDNCNGLNAGAGGPIPEDPVDSGTMINAPRPACVPAEQGMQLGTSSLSVKSGSMPSDPMIISPPPICAPQPDCGVGFVQTLMPIPIGTHVSVQAYGGQGVTSYGWAGSPSSILGVLNFEGASATIRGERCGEAQLTVTAYCGVFSSSNESSDSQMVRITGDQNWCMSARSRKDRLMRILRSEEPIQGGSSTLSQQKVRDFVEFVQRSEELVEATKSMADEVVEWLGSCVRFYLTKRFTDAYGCLRSKARDADMAIQEWIEAFGKFESARIVGVEATLKLEQQLTRSALELANQLASCCGGDNDVQELESKLRNSDDKIMKFRPPEVIDDTGEDLKDLSELEGMCSDQDKGDAQNNQCIQDIQGIRDRLDKRTDELNNQLQKNLNEYCELEEDPEVCKGLETSPDVELRPLL